MWSSSEKPLPGLKGSSSMEALCTRLTGCLCGYGGIGRHARFRFWWATVQVRLLLSAPGRRFFMRPTLMLLPSLPFPVLLPYEELRGQRAENILLRRNLIFWRNLLPSKPIAPRIRDENLSSGKGYILHSHKKRGEYCGTTKKN